MTEPEARLALLQTELSGLQESIRSLDNTMFQIKGWCVTASLAIGGFAAGYRGLGYSERIAVVFPAFIREARTPNTFSIYLFIVVCLLIEMIILF